MANKTSQAPADATSSEYGRAEDELYTVDNWSLDESLGHLIAQVKGRLATAIDAELAPLGITGPQWVTLVQIANGRADTASDLCRNSACDTGSMTRMLDRLEQKGFLRRERSAEDRRVVYLRLTEAGKALYPQLPPVAVKVLNRMLRGFSREELETMKGYLRRIMDNADRA
ncbi:MAG: MarR family transcriptional regulator [Gammaproteobacteria bacterium]|nr:MarR family transcriptional regulator [Gammaproteobacteria bacterium]MCP5425621.1 MarR family transcriptional regulator [Gammaproteobacteria bacterium]